MLCWTEYRHGTVPSRPRSRADPPGTFRGRDVVSFCARTIYIPYNVILVFGNASVIYDKIFSSITMHVNLDHYKQKKDEENLYSKCAF